MEHMGLWSLLPIVLAVGLAIFTGKVILSLCAGVFAGVLILVGGNPVTATIVFIRDYLVVQLTDSYNAGVLVLLVFIGGFVGLMERSGGAEAFARHASSLLATPRKVQLAAWLGGVSVFFSDLGTPLIVGPIFEPLVDKVKVSREKLAWILDSTASPVAVLVPITGWAVYIMGLLDKELAALSMAGADWSLFVRAIPFNFFSILTVLLVPAVVIPGWDVAAMRRAERRAGDGSLFWPDARPLRRPAQTSESDGDKQASLVLVWLPLLVLFGTLFGILAPEGFPRVQVPGSAFRTALTAGYFFAGVTLLVLVTSTRVKTFDRAFAIYTDGMSRMMTVAAILVLAWALGAVGRELGTAVYVIELVRAGVPTVLVPALIFLVGAVMSFATGSSWGSFAIMLPLVIPLGDATGLSLPLCVGAVLAGGLFGDHASPISDTTILSSTGAGCDHMDHVRTQLPYALAVAGGSLLAYLAAGFLSSPAWLLLAGAVTLGALWTMTRLEK